ncbi:MAG: polysaccharide deacetylase family protein [Petrotogales bacterium]
MYKQAIITTSWDDGHPLDLKLAKLLKQYNVKGTFYIPIKNNEREVMDEDQILQISKNFDIGGHTYSHQYLNRVSSEEAYNEIKKGKEELERILGYGVYSFCYPGGNYNQNTLKLVKKAGFAGARTVNQLKLNFNSPYEMDTTVHVSGKLFGHLKNYFNRLGQMIIGRPIGAPKEVKALEINYLDLNKDEWFLLLKLMSKNSLKTDWVEVTKTAIEHVNRRGGIFHLWGHSWEIEKYNLWGQLEGILKLLSKYRNASYVDNTELIKYKTGDTH